MFDGLAIVWLQEQGLTGLLCFYSLDLRVLLIHKSKRCTKYPGQPQKLSCLGEDARKAKCALGPSLRIWKAGSSQAGDITSGKVGGAGWGDLQQAKQLWLGSGRGCSWLMLELFVELKENVLGWKFARRLYILL